VRPAFSRRLPPGDSLPRRVCDHCGFIDYVNPRLVVGAVATWGERLLLCRRAIEPRRGYWTVPAGFLEQGETCAQGAAREAREEAGADLAVGALLGLYDVARIGQVHLFYRATLRNAHIQAGAESLEVALMTWDELPWSELAFPTVQWALHAFDAVRGQEVFAPHGNPAGERGEFPLDWHGRPP
jgi:ADP-ribose pyrophosphatase YjhB (NUDIX family)